MDDSEKSVLVELTTRIVSAYVSNNTVSVSDLPSLINDTHSALSRASGKSAEPLREELKPAVPIKKSRTEDHISCLECGKQFKSVKRHLRTHHNLSPEEYRDKWQLPHDYPEARSRLAKKMGLGTRREK